MKLLNKEPAVIIGVIASALLAAISVLSNEGILGADIAETIYKALDPTSGWALPIIIGIVTRFFVFSPEKAAELKAEVPEGYVLATPGDDV